MGDELFSVESLLRMPLREYLERRTAVQRYDTGLGDETQKRLLAEEERCRDQGESVCCAHVFSLQRAEVLCVVCSVSFSLVSLSM